MCCSSLAPGRLGIPEKQAEKGKGTSLIFSLWVCWLSVRETNSLENLKNRKIKEILPGRGRPLSNFFLAECAVVNHGVRVVFAEVSAVCGFGTPLGWLLKLLWFPHTTYCASSVPQLVQRPEGMARGTMPAVASVITYHPVKFSCNFLLSFVCYFGG